jgi:hypothetical protein
MRLFVCFNIIGGWCTCVFGIWCCVRGARSDVLGSGGRGFGGESAERDGSIAPRRYGSEEVKEAPRRR